MVAQRFIILRLFTCVANLGSKTVLVEEKHCSPMALQMSELRDGIQSRIGQRSYRHSSSQSSLAGISANRVTRWSRCKQVLIRPLSKLIALCRASDTFCSSGSRQSPQIDSRSDPSALFEADTYVSVYRASNSIPTTKLFSAVAYRRSFSQIRRRSHV